MSFILNLITFVLIVVGLIMILGTMPSNRKSTMDKLNYDSQSQSTKSIIDSMISGLYVKGVFAFVLGIGIIVARIFS